MARPVVVVLAGGEGRRIGGAKATRVLGGRALLERALDRAASWSDEVAVAMRSEGQASIPEGVDMLTDDPAIPGPLAGIASALRYASARGAQTVLTLPCDAPFLPDDLVDRLAEALTLSAGVALARSGGQLHPTCALWRAGEGTLAALSAYASTGRGALMGLADAVGWVAVDWPAEPLDPFFNVNTVEDLARAEALLEGPGSFETPS